jgi:hypothetical protein
MTEILTSSGKKFKGATIKNTPTSQVPVFTSVILPTQETAIRRITVGSQPGQIVCKILS